MWKWLRNPTLSNTKPTWYVSHRGDDTTGDGTAQNPYKTIAKATSEGAAEDNIMLDDGVWSQQRTLNNRRFSWWGNGKTWIKRDIVNMTIYLDDNFYHLKISGGTAHRSRFFNCIVSDISININGGSAHFVNCEVTNFTRILYNSSASHDIHNNVFINCTVQNGGGSASAKIYGNIFIGSVPNFTQNEFLNHNNYTTNAIPTNNGANADSINDASTGQTAADYFNNPALGDYTAKAGSANLGAGFNKQDIGFSLGLTMYATDPCFLPENGAIWKNVMFEDDCFKIVYRDKSFVSATLTTMVLDPAYRSLVDDHYNDLILSVISGTGEGQKTLITDYNATTGEITFDAIAVAVDETSRVTISGLLISGVKYFGGSYKIARNHFLANFGFNEIDPAEWTEFNAINPKVSSFGLKYSDFNNLEIKNWYYMGANGLTLSDSSKGDADDDFNEANAKPVHIAYNQVQIPFITS